VDVGNNVAIDTGTYITTEAIVGDYIHIGPYVVIIGGEKSKVEVENFASIAAGTRILAGSDEFMGEGLTSVTVPEAYRDRVKHSVVRIERFVGVGANVVILPGVILAEGSVVGAGSLVTKNTEPWTIYVGVPARPVKLRKREKMIAFAKELGYE